MNFLPRSVLLFFLIYFTAFYAWIFLFQEHDWLRFFGVNIFAITGSLISFVWLFQTYRAIQSPYRYFWLLLSFGSICFIIAYSICFYYQNILKVAMPYPGSADFFWLAAYGFSLLAFLFEIKRRIGFDPVRPFIFNILLVMIIAGALSLQYVIAPVLEIGELLLLPRLVALAYPVLDLFLLFSALTLYYVVQRRSCKQFTLTLLIGFLIQIFMDTYYVYTSLHENLPLSSVLEPWWQVPLLIKGAGALYAKNHFTEADFAPGSSSDKVYSYSMLPYLSVLFLLILIISQYSVYFNFLISGGMLAVIMIIMYQFSMMRKQEELMKKYEELAHRDPVTSLYNRAKFAQDLKKIIETPHDSCFQAAVLLLDLDRFKIINDTLGHPIGDDLLKQMAAELEEEMHGRGTVYRMGGDEFLIILPGVTDSSLAMQAADELLVRLQHPFFINGHELLATASIGISMYPEHGKEESQLLKRADAAMYAAKEKGKNGFQFYTPDLNEQLTRKMLLEKHLRKAIENNEFYLEYQPKINLHTRQAIGSEALLRWKHPELGVISPAEFIPIAEETGQIVLIGHWVLQTACRQSKLWQNKHQSIQPVAVNVSVRQFQQKNFLSAIQRILLETKLDPQFLELEITESVIQNLQQSSDILWALKQLGVRTAIDDFGTGYSSLNVLKSLPVDVIKLDKSFIDDLADPANKAIVKMIAEFAETLDLQVVAEGIEKEGQADLLVEYRCCYGQGYLFEKPLSAKEFERRWIKQGKNSKVNS